jgi:hypothetical protein
MEKKIQELKTKLLNDLEMFMHSSIEQFTSLLSDISNEYLVKTKERELELKDEVAKLSKDKDEMIIYINGSKEKASEFIKKEKELEDRESKLKSDEYKFSMIKGKIMEDKEFFEIAKNNMQKEKDAFEKEKQQFQVQKAMVEEQVKTLRKLNI